MRLLELLEDQTQLRPLSPRSEDVAEFVQANCQPWIKAAGSARHSAYRGLGGTTQPDAFVAPIRQDRYPKDSPMSAHLFFNKLIDMAGGTANRSNSAFVTGNDERAASYGRPFIVMPVGDFHYTWSPRRGLDDWFTGLYEDPTLRREITTSWLDLDKVAETPYFKSLLDNPGYQEFNWSDRPLEQVVPEMIMQGLLSTKKIELYDPERVKQDIWVDRGLPQAIGSGAEIMIHAKEMLYVSTTSYAARGLI